MSKTRWGGGRRERRFSRRDANHEEIVSAFESVGWTVVDLGTVKMSGVPDILVGGQIRGGPDAGQRVNILVEIKTATGETRGNQDEFADSWRGRPVELIRTREEVLELVGLVVKRKGPGGGGVV